MSIDLINVAGRFCEQSPRRTTDNSYLGYSRPRYIGVVRSRRRPWPPTVRGTFY